MRQSQLKKISKLKCNSQKPFVLLEAHVSANYI